MTPGLLIVAQLKQATRDYRKQKYVVASTLYIKREKLAFHAGLQPLSPFWAGERGLLANSGVLYSKLGRSNPVLAVGLAVHLP